MSKRRAGKPPKKMRLQPPPGVPPKVAEEFMALMIAALKSSHVCPWCDYFKKMGTEAVGSFVPKEWME